ncbi:MAG: SHOCT-like domain-containing protein [Halanaerobium sp.]
MSEEKMRILEMLQDGKINAEETEKLLAALGEESAQAKAVQLDSRNDEGKEQGEKKRHLRIIVNEAGKEKVNMSLPLGIAKTLLNFVPQSAKDKMAEKDIDLNALTKTIDDLSEEKEILRVEDEGETVIIRVE